ncbi:MAG: Fic family protein, partial [Proteiniphilum sp.]|nr:Fic family protein [Proteiniphilum sp.]
LYLSDFFERHRSLYYDNLTRVRTHGDINQWLKFFLSGVIETSQKGVNTLDSIMHMKQSIEKQMDTLGKRSAEARLVIDHMYKKPILSAKELIELTGKSSQTVYNLLADLERLQIIKEITGAQRYKLYLFELYINCFK